MCCYDFDKDEKITILKCSLIAALIIFLILLPQRFDNSPKKDIQPSRFTVDLSWYKGQIIPNRPAVINPDNKNISLVNFAEVKTWEKDSVLYAYSSNPKTLTMVATKYDSKTDEYKYAKAEAKMPEPIEPNSYWDAGPIKYAASEKIFFANYYRNSHGEITDKELFLFPLFTFILAYSSPVFIKLILKELERDGSPDNEIEIL